MGLTKNYVNIYSEVPKSQRAAGGVMMCIHQKYKDIIDKYNIYHERIMLAKLKFQNGFITIIEIYSPEEGRNKMSEDFYAYLQKAIQKTP
ncbi:hypothetical protein PGB90_001342 [Kerria lacca]